MFFTIEPMINVGKADCKLLDDGWTAVTRDRPLGPVRTFDQDHRNRARDLYAQPDGLDRPPYA